MNLIPLPTNLFPYWFFPWTTNSWPGFTKFVYHKEILVIDALRQIFVWKDFAFSLLGQGIIPLWNPYSFSGQPLLANFQSAVFYPLSWLFFLPSHLFSWSVFILLQPVLAGIFMYLFLRAKNLGKIPAIFGAISLICCSFFATRYFWGNLVHTLLWLPLGLYLIDKISDVKKFIALEGIVIALAILGGYPQFSIFVCIILLTYFLFRQGIKKVFIFFLALTLALLICAIQLLPTAELYQNSLREGVASKESFSNSLLSPEYLVSILSPDFLGSPATNNYKGDKDYSGMNAYFGIIPLALSLYALKFFKRNREIRFWALVGLAGLVFSYKNPVAFLPSLLNIPILSSGGAWSNLFFFQFGAIILSSFGLNQLLIKRDKKFFLVSLIVLVCLIFLMFFARNTTTIIVPFAAFLIATWFFPKKTGLLAIVFTAIAGVYFLQKISPFGETKYFYPDHPLITFLQNNAGYNRFWGPTMAKIPSNLSTFYHIYSPEGYDSLFPKWYGELIQTAKTGIVSEKLNRADIFIDDQPTFYRDRLLNLLGVKYILSPDATAFENKTAFPRAFMANSVLVTTDLIKNIYDPNIDLRLTVILEKDPVVSKLATGSAEIIDYHPNKVTIKTNSSGPSMLFLSDTYFPGWNAFVNGRYAEIFKADYAFRAVSVPTGQNTVNFIYDPDSFKHGLTLTIFGLLILGYLLI